MRHWNGVFPFKLEARERCLKALRKAGFDRSAGGLKFRSVRFSNLLTGLKQCIGVHAKDRWGEL